MKSVEERLVDLELCVLDQDKMLDDLNHELIRMSHLVDYLLSQNKILREALKESPVKPLSEETKPPHY